MYLFTAKTTGSSVSVLPLAGSGLNTITTPSGVKMIVVSSASLTQGQQGITLMTTSSTSGKWLICHLTSVLLYVISV